MGGFDLSTYSKAFSRPGIDPRQWVSFGVVTKETANAQIVTFDKTIGMPLVSVLLQPSEVFVACQVANHVAGNGEGEWFPFVDGDQVIVAVPGGDEKSGCVILGRLNSQLDEWPSQVAGSDSTKNNFAFKRLRTPYVLETAETLLFRSAKTEAFLSLNKIGEWTLSNTEGYISVASDFITMQSADTELVCQLNLRTKIVALEAGGTLLHLKADEDTQLLTPNRVLIGTSGSFPTAFHGVTAESVAVFLQSFAQTIGLLFPSMLFGGALAAAAIPLINAALTQAIALPITPLLPGMTAALSAPPDNTGIQPHFGVAGLLIS